MAGLSADADSSCQHDGPDLDGNESLRTADMEETIYTEVNWDADAAIKKAAFGVPHPGTDPEQLAISRELAFMWLFGFNFAGFPVTREQLREIWRTKTL